MERRKQVRESAHWHACCKRLGAPKRGRDEILLAKIANWWENACSSLWFIPALLVLAAAGLSWALLTIDDAFGADIHERAPWLFGGTASAARSLLSTIAGSFITVVAVAFSVTIVALQQAASQYTPRILRTFTSDRGNQVVLGTYIATFTYALLIMRQVRERTEGQDAFVPALSISMAIALALIGLGLLVYFIHHVSQSLQVSAIYTSITREVEGHIEKLFPSTFGRASVEPPEPRVLAQETARYRRGAETVVESGAAGYLRRIDEGQLVEAADGEAHLVWVEPRIGDFVERGAALARIWADDPLPKEQYQQVRAAFVLDVDRSLHQDLLYGIRQIVDIGLKALSPGVNDPTTAEQCLDHLGSILAQLAEREFPSPVRRTEQRPLYVFNRPSFGDYAHASLSQLREAAEGQSHVTLHFLEVLRKLADRVPTPERAAPLRSQAEDVLAALPSSGVTQARQQTIRAHAAGVIAALSRPIPQPGTAA